ncbi:MAG: hypothetical protein WBB85_14895 [Albidovulum sp.]|uniref:hypothetical protein n=1 Tax=Albidovulum sp. TaxID=1872424 RepID=UPI003C868D78
MSPARFLALVLFVIATAPSFASTVDAVAQGQGTQNCLDSQTNFGISASALALCSTGFTQGGLSESISAAARASYGDLGVSGSVSISGNSLASSGFFGRALFGASFSDVLTFGVSAGSISIPVDIAGNIINFISQAAAQITFGVSLGSTTVYAISAVATDLGPSSAQVTGSTGITNVLIPFTGGQLRLDAGIAGSVSCMNGGGSFSCSSAADFFNSARLLAATVFDTSGNQILNPSITSESGFDYLAGVSPHQPAPIPVPASALMLFAALLSLAGARRLKKINLIRQA